MPPVNDDLSLLLANWTGSLAPRTRYAEPVGLWRAVAAATQTPSMTILGVLLDGVSLTGCVWKRVGLVTPDCVSRS